MNKAFILALSLCTSFTIECIKEKTYFGFCGKIYTIDIVDQELGTITKYRRREDGTYTRKVIINNATTEKQTGLTENDLRNSQEVNANNEIDTHFLDDEMSE